MQVGTPGFWLVLSFSGVSLILFLIAGLIGMSQRRKRARCTQQTVAVVERIVQDLSRHVGDSSVHLLLYPVFSYYANGHQIIQQSNFGRDKPVFRVGQRVSLWFDPDNPCRFYVPSDGTGKLICRLLQLIGGLFLGLAGVAACLLYAGVF